MKEDQNLQTKIYTVITALQNHFQVIQTNQETNHHLTQFIEVDPQNKEIHEVFHKKDIVDHTVEIIENEKTIHHRIRTEENCLIPVAIQTLGIDAIPTIDHEIHHTIEIETIPTIEMEAIQITEISITQTTDQEITHTIDQIIKDPRIIIKTDQETIHKIETQIITINKTISNLLKGIITITPINNSDMETIHRSIKDKLIKYKQQKKQLQTPRCR